MKINFNKILTNLSGKEVEDTNIGKILAEAMALQPRGEIVRVMDWSLKIYNQKDIELNKSDHKWLKDFISNHEGFSIILKYQLLECLGEFKEE